MNAEGFYKIPCPHCGEKIEFQDDMLGITSSCPSCMCSLVLKVPGLEKPAPPQIPQSSPVPPQQTQSNDFAKGAKFAAGAVTTVYTLKLLRFVIIIVGAVVGAIVFSIWAFHHQ